MFITQTDKALLTGRVAIIAHRGLLNISGPTDQATRIFWVSVGGNDEKGLTFIGEGILVSWSGERGLEVYTLRDPERPTNGGVPGRVSMVNPLSKHSDGLRTTMDVIVWDGVTPGGLSPSMDPAKSRGFVVATGFTDIRAVPVIFGFGGQISIAVRPTDKDAGRVGVALYGQFEDRDRHV